MSQNIEEDIISITDNIRYLNSTKTNFIETRAPASLSTNVDFEFPSTNGSNGEVLSWNSGATTWSTPESLRRTWVLKDEKSTGTNGGTFTSGAWQTRDLNTINSLTSDTSVTLSSNQFTLTGGEYYIEALALCENVGDNKVRIQNITDGITEIVGLNQASSGIFGIASGVSPVIKGFIDISTTKTFELQHRCDSTVATIGFGAAVGFGVNEVYSIVTIVKISD